MEQTWLVTYDVSDDGCRRRVERILLGHGEREQYSVFRCRLSSREVCDLRARLAGHLKGSDSIRYYPLCAACLPRQPQRTLVDSAEAGIAWYFAVWNTLFVFISYDIADPGRLRRVATLCEGYGERVQKSVFECHLKPAQLQELRDRLARIVRPDEDKLFIATLCRADAARILVDGHGHIARDWDYWLA